MMFHHSVVILAKENLFVKKKLKQCLPAYGLVSDEAEKFCAELVCSYLKTGENQQASKIMISAKTILNKSFFLNALSLAIG